MPNAKPAQPRPAAKSATSRSAASGEFIQVQVAPRTARTLSGHAPNVQALMEVLGDTIEASRKTGQPAGFTVQVDRQGRPRILPQPAPATAQAADDDDLDRALDAARARGRLRAAEVLNGPEMLSADAFAELLGVSRVTVNAKRQKNEVLALDGAKRGFRFPAWQVDENGKPLGILAQLSETLGGPWTVYRFLLQRHPDLGGQPALEAIRKGRAAEVLAAAEAQAEGAFA